MRRHTGLAALATTCVLVLAACTSGSDGNRTDDPAPPSGTPGETTSTPDGAPTSTGPDDTAAPPPPTPSAARESSGPLQGQMFPQQVGTFEVAPAEADEGEFNPNETPYYELDAQQSSFEALMSCSGEVPTFTAPTNALGAYYRNPDDAPGRGLMFQFTSAAEAEGYFTIVRDLVQQCADTDGAFKEVDDLQITDTQLIDRVTFEGADQWSELVVVKDDRVAMLILNDAHQVSAADLEQAATSLGEG